MLVCLILSQRSLKLISFIYLFFAFCFSVWVISTILSSMSFMHYSVSPNLLLIPSSVFFITVIVFFSSDWLFFIFSKSLLKFSLCSSISSWVWWVFLWPLLWTLCQVNYLSPFHRVYFWGFIFSFIWNLFLCLLILFDFLCLSVLN